MTEKKAEWKELGNRLKETREYQGYSQKEVAEYLDISRPSVSLIENGERKIDSIEVQNLSELYNMSIDELVGQPSEGRKGRKDVELVARATQDLSEEDQKEVLRFAEFLRSRNPGSEENGKE